MQHGSHLHLRGQKLRLMPVVLLIAFALSFTQIPTAYAGEHYPACGNATSFQNAVNNANNNGEDDYIGLYGTGCTYNLTKSLVIEPDGVLTIEGNGSVINGGDQYTPFYVKSGATLILNNVEIKQGRGWGIIINQLILYYGGAIYIESGGTVTINNSSLADSWAYFGGAVYNEGQLILNASTISHNKVIRSPAGTYGGFGGGIYNEGGSVSLTNSALIGNNSQRSGAGINNQGGTVELTRSGLAYNYTVSDNEADDGGGIFNQADGTLTITASNIYGNSVGRGGGGILNAGSATITGSLFTDNDAVYGGGLWNKASGTATLTNTTLFANAASQNGGGIDNDGTLTLTNSTLVSNSAVNAGGNILNYTEASLTIGNTILAASAHLGGNCVNSGGTFTVTGTNLVEDGACNIHGAITGNPKLGDLVGNPGYFPLLAGSPAIDAGVNLNCPSHDQRGAGRPMDGNGDGTATCDIGAFEADPIPVTPPLEVELLVNRGFENKTQTNTPQLAPWTLPTGTGDKIKCNTATQTVAYEGLCAFMFKGGPSENVTLTQKVALTSHTFTAGDKLRLSLRVKAPNAAAKGKIKLQVKFSDSSAPQQIVLPLGKTGGYAHLAEEITLQSGQVSQIRLQINHKSRSGKVYLDAISLLQIKASQPLTSSQLIPLPEAPPADMRSNGS